MITTVLATILVTSTQTAEISWYGKEWHGKKTASGQRYDMNSMTCAVVYRKGTNRPAIPFGTKIIIYYGGKSVQVTINNTGSYKPKKSNMWFDLSPAAFKKLAPLNKGRAVATWKIVK